MCAAKTIPVALWAESTAAAHTEQCAIVHLDEQQTVVVSCFCTDLLGILPADGNFTDDLFGHQICDFHERRHSMCAIISTRCQRTPVLRARIIELVLLPAHRVDVFALCEDHIAECSGLIDLLHLHICAEIRVVFC